MLNEPRGVLAILLMDVVGEPVANEIQKREAHGVIPHLATRKVFLNLPDKIAVFGAMLYQRLIIRGLHERFLG